MYLISFEITVTDILLLPFGSVLRHQVWFSHLSNCITIGGVPSDSYCIDTAGEHISSQVWLRATGPRISYLFTTYAYLRFVGPKMVQLLVLYRFTTYDDPSSRLASNAIISVCSTVVFVCEKYQKWHC